MLKESPFVAIFSNNRRQEDLKKEATPVGPKGKTSRVKNSTGTLCNRLHVSTTTEKNCSNTTESDIVATTHSSIVTVTTSSSELAKLMFTELDAFNVQDDRGSKKSNITAELVTILKLPIKGKEEFSVFTFSVQNLLPCPVTHYNFLGIQKLEGVFILFVKAPQFLTSNMKVASFIRKLCNSNFLSTVSKKFNN
ncbi:hypothetical protein RB195_002783 [Necator americanus]|uniref:Uncharacterized protein n=1 Tax=Necator americanus TaxID=51031 RepID=A0ABR1DKV6_NECAM